MSRHLDLSLAVAHPQSPKVELNVTALHIPNPSGQMHNIKSGKYDSSTEIIGRAPHDAIGCLSCLHEGPHVFLSRAIRDWTRLDLR